MGTEGAEINFSDKGITRIAEIAWQVNEQTENIGARRLHTVMERLLEPASFAASDWSEGDPAAKVSVDTDYVNKHLGELVEDEDLSRYIL